MVWIIWIIRIVWVIAAPAPIITWICPIIRGVAIVWIPVRIPAVVIIWPSEAKTSPELNCDVGFRGFFHYVNGVNNPFNTVDYSVFFVILTRFTFHGVGIEIAVV